MPPLFVCLSVCVSVCSSGCLLVWFSVSLSLFLYWPPCLCISERQTESEAAPSPTKGAGGRRGSTIPPSVRTPACLCVCLFVWLPVRLVLYLSLCLGLCVSL